RRTGLKLIHYIVFTAFVFPSELFFPYVRQTFIFKFNQLLCAGGAVCRQSVGGRRQFPLGGCVSLDIV
ncbi:hypothetical protein, partial [Neisseria sp. HMSC074B07]|uniref:hypothetical protein n=1 Tax=Neisseria sp. HMSC074B07 TaxID=1715205 RepID=UPI001FEE8AA9